MKFSIDRFMQRVDKTNSCWLWLGSRTLRGYGRCEWGSHKLAHRLSYVLFKGLIPNGKQINHSCDNPPCVNPAHLIAGTQSENLRDASRKGRLPSQKLTYDQANQIRTLYKTEKVSMVAIGKRFGVSDQSVCDIVNNVSYI